MKSDTLPPHSIPDEKGVIACVLMDAQHCLPECAKVTPECFYDALHQSAWRAIKDLSSQNVTINRITVARWMETKEQVADAFLRLGEVEDGSPTPHNLPYYLPSLLDLTLRRRLIRGCAELSAQAMNGHTTDAILFNAERLLSIQSPTTAPILDGNDAGLKLVEDLERRHALNGALPGLDTGLDRLNSKIDGLQFGEQTLIAARPSIGKTAIGLGIFSHCVFTLKLPALFVSLEMSAPALMRRMLSDRSGITMGVIRRGSYTERDFLKFSGFRSAAKKSPLHILDGASGLSIGELCVSVRRHVRKHGIKLVVVDYLQKVRPSEKHEKRTYEVADVSGKLRALAVETGAAFLTLAQLNRESEKDKPRTPRLSDLADSGQIERDADTIILLDRKRDDREGEAHLIIAKQRDGETGLVTVKFNGALCRFENPSPIHQDDIPPANNPHND